MSGKIIPKNYGSIPHFSFSRLGEKDYHCSDGHEKILTKQARDYKDLIIVQEKLDGSNVGIVKKNDKIIAIVRSGYGALSSQYKQHVLFDKWVNKNYDYFYNLLNEGERICGEWLLLVHGTKYNIENENDLFRPFDIIDNSNQRILYIDFIKRIDNKLLKTPELLHIGQPINIKHIENKLCEIDKNRIDKCEGAVYRCERDNKVEFLVKYVRYNKVDGAFMNDELYNYDIKRIL